MCMPKYPLMDGWMDDILYLLHALVFLGLLCIHCLFTFLNMSSSYLRAKLYTRREKAAIDAAAPSLFFLSS